MRVFENIPELVQPGDSIAEWEARRKNTIETIANIEYGCRPEIDYTVNWNLLSRDTVLDGKAERLITDIIITTKLGSYSFPLYTFLPVTTDKVPATLLICSQARVLAPQQLPEGFCMDDLPKLFEKMNIIMDGPMDLSGPKRALDMAVDMDNGHWPVPMMIERRHAISGFYATDAQPDNGNFTEGLCTIFGTTKERAEHEWGVLAIWSFAAKCALDYLKTLPEINSNTIGITGHSRCGKSALWAGATDERFAWVMPNDSGCCGAALLRGKHGENINSINLLMPYWFAPAFGKYIGHEYELPFDQHTLLALVAPRLLHVASGSLDFWADPVGEHHSLILAGKVYELYGNPKMPEEFPEDDTSIEEGAVAYHLRTGPHLLAEFDWKCLAEHIEHYLQK